MERESVSIYTNCDEAEFSHNLYIDWVELEHPPNVQEWTMIDNCNIPLMHLSVDWEIDRSFYNYNNNLSNKQITLLVKTWVVSWLRWEYTWRKFVIWKNRSHESNWLKVQTIKEEKTLEQTDLKKSKVRLKKSNDWKKLT